MNSHFRSTHFGGSEFASSHFARDLVLVVSAAKGGIDDSLLRIKRLERKTQERVKMLLLAVMAVITIEEGDNE